MADLRVCVIGTGAMGTDHIIRINTRMSGGIVTAIVEPDAVVVEILRASVAPPAVLRRFVHRCITEVTEEVEVFGFLKSRFLTIKMSNT